MPIVSQGKANNKTIEEETSKSTLDNTNLNKEYMKYMYPMLKTALNYSNAIEQEESLKANWLMRQLLNLSASSILLNTSKVFTNYEYNNSIKKTYSRVSSYGVSSQMGVVPKRPNKPNQDAYFTIENFMDIENAYLFGIMDGHGPFGKEASTFVKKLLPANISDIGDNLPYKSSETKNLLLTNTNIRTALINEAYKKTNEELVTSGIDLLYSGTTSVTAFTCDSLLVCANVGDSRAVIGSFDYKNPETKWKAHQITIDHKPELEGEYRRILTSNGRVEPYKGNGID